MRTLILLVLAGSASAQITPLISFDGGAVAPPNLLSHTVFACGNSATFPCTSGSGTSPLAGAAINTAGATLIVATVGCGCSTDLGQGWHYTFGDSQSNTWAVLPVAAATGNTVTVQTLYALSPSTSASHTFKISSASGGPGGAAQAFTVSVAAYSNIASIISYSSAIGSGLTIQPGSLTPATGTVEVSGVEFNSSGTAPTINSGFSVTDAAAGNSSVNFPGGMAYIAGSGGSLNPTWTTTGGSSAGTAAYASVFSSTSGSSVSPPTLRGSGVANSSAASYNLNWPAGTASGDTAVVFCGHAFVCNLPSGWTSVDSQTGSFWNGATFSKTLNGTDISNGHVTVTTTGSFDGYLAIATFVGGFTVSLGHSIRSVNGLTTIADGAVVPAGSYALYFGSNRANVTTSVSVGSMLQQGNDGSAAAGALYGQSFSTANGAAPYFNFAGGGTSTTGFYTSLVYVH